MKKTKKLVYASILVAMALIFSYVEHLLPFDFGIPGIKLGLANAAIVPVLFIFDERMSAYVQTGRILLSALLFGSVMSLWYSLAGGFLSLIGMILLKRTGKFKVIGISAIGGVLHNIGQLTVATLVLGTEKLLYYLPILSISGVVTGVLIGIISALIIRYFPQRILTKKQ